MPAPPVVIVGVAAVQLARPRPDHHFAAQTSFPVHYRAVHHLGCSISKADGTSINQFVATAVAEKVSAMRTAEFFTGRAAQADVEAARRLLRREGGQTPEPEDQFE